MRLVIGLGMGICMCLKIGLEIGIYFSPIIFSLNVPYPVSEPCAAP